MSTSYRQEPLALVLVTDDCLRDQANRALLSARSPVVRMLDFIERGLWKKRGERRQTLYDSLMEAEESGT